MNIKELIQKYSLAKDDCWQLPQNSRLWIVSHDACEKIASIENIRLDDIKVISSEWNFCRLIVTMSKGEKQIKTIGEALLIDGTNLEKTTRSGKPVARGNCESQYIGCMAEKRGIDRAILKLINAYEYGIYSDSEDDSFKKSNSNTENILKNVSQNIGKEKPVVSGFSEKADEKVKIGLQSDLFEMGRPYAKEMNDEEKLFFANIKNAVNYTAEQYKADKAEVNSIIDKYEKIEKIIDSEPLLTDDSDVMPEFLSEDEQKDDILPNGVL